MKYVLTYIILLACCFACRSNKRDSSSYLDKSQIKSQNSVLDTKSTETHTEQEDTAKKIAVENKYCRVVNFDSLGRISSIREEWWDTRSAELDVRNRRSSSNTLDNRKEESVTEENADIEAYHQSESNNDSRPVQGFEWLYIIIPVVIGLLIFLLIKYRKKWQKK